MTTLQGMLHSPNEVTTTSSPITFAQSILNDPFVKKHFAQYGHPGPYIRSIKANLPTNQGWQEVQRKRAIKKWLQRAALAIITFVAP